MEEYLKVGEIMRTHGIHGEVKVYPTTDSPDRFRDLKEIYLKTKNTGEYRLLHVNSCKFFKNQVILGFDEYTDIDESQSLAHGELYVDRSQGVELAENEYYSADIIGCSVVLEDGSPLGTVDDIIDTGANDVYVVKRPGKKDLLIPAISSCVISVNVPDSVITVRLLPGLYDLYE